MNTQQTNENKPFQDLLQKNKKKCFSKYIKASTKQHYSECIKLYLDFVCFLPFFTQV